MFKVAMDEEAIKKDMLARVEKFKNTNLPKGLPTTQNNQDVTDPDYPISHNAPKDQGWGGVKMITGSGNGPIL